MDHECILHWLWRITIYGISFFRLVDHLWPQLPGKIQHFLWGQRWKQMAEMITRDDRKYWESFVSKRWEPNLRTRDQGVRLWRVMSTGKTNEGMEWVQKKIVIAKGRNGTWERAKEEMYDAKIEAKRKSETKLWVKMSMRRSGEVSNQTSYLVGYTVKAYRFHIHNHHIPDFR